MYISKYPQYFLIFFGTKIYQHNKIITQYSLYFLTHFFWIFVLVKKIKCLKSVLKILVVKTLVLKILV